MDPNKKVKQLGWSAMNMWGISYTTTPGFYRRFTVIKTTQGFTVTDKETNELARTTTLPAARAWAGIRVNEQCVRRQ